MSTLYQRVRPVFVGADNGSIVDLRIHWTADCVTSTPNTLSRGETALVSASFSDPTFTLAFAARHPLLDDVYYTKTVTGSLAVQDLLPYDVTEGSYLVVDPEQPGITFQYLVGGGGVTRQLVSTSIIDQNVTVLINFSDGASWPAANTIIEPFNVIFDYIPQAVSSIVPYISGGVSVNISGASFTNTPIGDSGARLETAHNFALVGSTLMLTGLPESPSSGQHIQSINGITAENGGITIKFLR